MTHRLHPDALRDAAIRAEICALCSHFYKLGWASGTGGGISIRSGETIWMAPSGVEKEKLAPADLFTVDRDGQVLTHPASDLSLTACAPLFLAAYRHRDAGAVLHSHSLEVILAAALVPPGESLDFTRLEMVKGLEGGAYFGTSTLPVIDNTALEHQLEERLEQAILDHAQASAVVVRNHGIYVWGRDVTQAKTQAECIDWLCSAKVRMHAAGIDHLRHDRSIP